MCGLNRTPDDIQDELLVLQCQEGDADAMRSLVARWQPRLSRFAWRLTLDREAARDVVQETWLAIVRGLRRIDDPARFRGWAYRIVANKCADWTRRRTVRREAARAIGHAAAIAGVEPAAVTDAIDEAAADRMRRLRTALANLPAEQRAILTLHYLDGMSVGEIAGVLSVPAGTVKSRLYHARNRLREAIERTKP
jgi:RNA polymerase sigma-70 factor (ECF subfamily)